MKAWRGRWSPLAVVEEEEEEEEEGLFKTDAVNGRVGGGKLFRG